MPPWAKVTNIILGTAIPVLEHLLEQLPDNKQAQQVVPEVIAGLTALQGLLQSL